MDTGSDPMEVLDGHECRALLASSEVGRIGVVIDGQPLIFPVNYLLDGNCVLVHTDVGSMLTAASLARVAFEVDNFDAQTRSGWSVLVQGIGHDVTDALDRTSEHLQTLQLSPWAPGPKPRLLRIDATAITGRRFRGDA